MKRLWRSRDNKVITGLIGGIGEYFDVDPSLLRVGYVFLTVFTALFLGVVAYFIASLIVSREPERISGGKGR